VSPGGGRGPGGLGGRLDDEREDVRTPALRTLAALGGRLTPAQVKALIGRLADENGYARLAALKALAAVGGRFPGRCSGREPFTGIGEPEPLRHELSGCSSRRVDREHRRIDLGCKIHYSFLGCVVR